MGHMKENADKPNASEDARKLRRKVKRIEESRSSMKTKSREKSNIIKTQQDRQTELKQNRDNWKAKCKEQERARIETDNKYNHVAALFEMKEEELRGILKEFEELKKKYPPKNQR